MFRYRATAAILLSVLTLSIPALPQSATNRTSGPRTKGRMSNDYQSIHSSAIVIDTHADTTQRLLDENFDMAAPAGYPGHLDFEKARRGNLSAQFFSIWVDDSNPENKGKFAHRTLDLIDSVYEQAQKHPDQMRMCFSAEDIVRNHAQPGHKLCALMGIEG